MQPTRYLIIPGWHGSPDNHWQSHWERTLPYASRVEQADWLRPDRDLWIAALQHAVMSDASPTVLIAHSLGCATVAHWARQAPIVLKRRVLGALLIAPADVERPGCPEALRPFAPLPDKALPFPALLVGSDNDPAATAERALHMGRLWSAETEILSGVGHLNVASGHTQWHEGFVYLDRLRRLIEERTLRRA
ncbi:RBBP9/YdeN family alpha/beta hydrolase [Pseudomonas sp. Marseille-QA0892]